MKTQGSNTSGDLSFGRCWQGTWGKILAFQGKRIMKNVLTTVRLAILSKTHLKFGVFFLFI